MDASEIPNILQATVDVALVLDEKGNVVDQLEGKDPVAGSEAWTGRSMRDTVTSATQSKFERLLDEANRSGVSRFRQVNHPTPGGDDVPVGYTFVRFGSPGRLLAIGRNLSALARVQRQLVEAQQSMESEYWYVRQAEARYRLLFQQASEPVFVVDADSLEVTDANNAAAKLLGTEAARLVGRGFPPRGFRPGPNFDDQARDDFVDTLTRVASGALERASITARIDDRPGDWRVEVSAVRFDGHRTLLVKLDGDQASDRLGPQGVDVMRLLHDSPDGFVVTDPDGDILYANQAFVNMAQVANQGALVGRSLATWLGRPGADLTVLLTNLRSRGQIRLFPTEVQGEQGLDTRVEVSGVAALESEDPCLGITLRDVGRRLPGSGENGFRDLTRAVQALSGRVGEVSLKQLVDDTVGLVELHFIDAALELTGDNRTAAAELLGLSRQSLYTKLKRYNLDNGDHN
jgi:transcriptional regulator PpsR